MILIKVGGSCLASTTNGSRLRKELPIGVAMKRVLVVVQAMVGVGCSIVILVFFTMHRKYPSFFYLVCFRFLLPVVVPRDGASVKMVFFAVVARDFIGKPADLLVAENCTLFSPIQQQK